MNWNTDSLWVEVALVCAINAVGLISMGHFEEQTPKPKRLLKLIVITTLVVLISTYLGRVWASSFIGAMLLFAVFIHAFWLPRKGINGWTGEPRDKYYEFRGWKKKE